MKKISKEKFIEDRFITCDKCGYNNEKDRFQAFGTCLHCGKVLDDKVHFKATLSKMVMRSPRSRHKGTTRAVLYF